MQYLQKLISTFHKKQADKTTAISPAIDSAPPMAKVTVRLEALITKQKQGQLTKANNANIYAKQT